MFGILCLACVVVLSENAWVNYETGIVALTHSSEIPEHLADVVEILPSNITVLTPTDYVTSLYIARKFDSADVTSESIDFTFEPTGTCTEFGVRFYVETNVNKVYGITFEKERNNLFSFNEIIVKNLDLSTLRMSIIKGTLYGKGAQANGAPVPLKLDFGSKYCGYTQGDLVICYLHFQRLGGCALNMKFDPQHHVVLFMPTAPEGESYFDEIFTQNPEIDYETSTSEPFEDTVSEIEPTEKRPFPLKALVSGILVVWCLVCFVIGIGLVLIFRKKCFKLCTCIWKPCCPCVFKTREKTRAPSKSRSRSRPKPKRKPQPQREPESQSSVVQAPLSQKYEEFNVVLEETCMQPSEPCQSTQKKATQQTEPSTTLMSFNPESSSATPLPSTENPKKPEVKPAYSPVLTIDGDVKAKRGSVKQEASKKSTSKKSTSKKSNKSFLQRAKDKIIPHPNPAVTPRNTSNATTRNSTQNSTQSRRQRNTFNIPILSELRREYIQIQNARKQRLAELEKKKLEQPTTTQTTFVNSEGERVLGVDFEGCEMTQHSNDDEYKVHVEDAIQAREDADRYDRLYTADGIPRNEQELAEYDAAKAAGKK